MLKWKKIKTIVLLGSVLCVLVFVFGIQQVVKVDRAHQTFNNYYTFRGCRSLVKKTESYGICLLPSGQTIKMVQFHGKWYLDGDLPTCFYNVCL